MAKNIIEYLPLFLKSVYEFKEIANSENIELDDLQSKTDSITNETIVALASEYGINRYEKIFNIVNKEQTLNERKFVIESIFSNRVPFSLAWLKNKLNQLVGKDNYIIDIDYANYKLTIKISYMFSNAVNLLKKDLRKSIPANLSLEVYQNQNEMSKLYTGGATVQGCFEELYEI